MHSPGRKRGGMGTDARRRLWAAGMIRRSASCCQVVARSYSLPLGRTPSWLGAVCWPRAGLRRGSWTPSRPLRALACLRPCWALLRVAVPRGRNGALRRPRHAAAGNPGPDHSSAPRQRHNPTEAIGHTGLLLGPGDGDRRALLADIHSPTLLRSRCLRKSSSICA